MKTAVTVVNTIQVSMDEYKDVRITKVFDDNQRLIDIKNWVKVTCPTHKNIEVSNISLSAVTFSDIND